MFAKAGGMKICLLIIMVILPFIEHPLVPDVLHAEVGMYLFARWDVFIYPCL